MRPTKEQIRHDLHELSEFIYELEETDDPVTKQILAGQLAFLVLMIRKRFRLTSMFYVTAEIQAENNYREVYGNDTSLDKNM